MMKFYTQFIALTLISVFVLGSCKNDNDDEIYDLLYAKLLPSYIVNEAGEDIQYTYDAKDRFTDIVIKKPMTNEDLSSYMQSNTYKLKYNTSTNNIDSLFILNLKYNDFNGKIDTISFSIDTCEYQYEGLKVISTINKVSRTINIDSNGRLLNHVSTSSSGMESVTLDYEYDENGNISKLIENKGESSENTLAYSYDNKKGLYKNVNTPQWFLADILNIRSGFYNNIQKVGDFDFIYSYSTNNYPRSINESSTNIDKNNVWTINYIQSHFYE